MIHPSLSFRFVNGIFGEYLFFDWIENPIGDQFHTVIQEELKQRITSNGHASYLRFLPLFIVMVVVS
jgi:hypothetical protein